MQTEKTDATTQVAISPEEQAALHIRNILIEARGLANAFLEQAGECDLMHFTPECLAEWRSLVRTSLWGALGSNPAVYQWIKLRTKIEGHPLGSGEVMAAIVDLLLPAEQKARIEAPAAADVSQTV